MLLKRLGVDQLISVTCHDVCGIEGEGGFGTLTSQSVDAVFLDLPEPWRTIPHVVKVLKPGRTLGSYSPCMEQVRVFKLIMIEIYNNNYN